MKAQSTDTMKAAPLHKRKCSSHLEELEKLLEISLTAASPSRKASFVDCVSAARRPSCEGLSTNASPRHGTRAVAAAAAAAAAASAGRSDRHGSADQGEGKNIIAEAGGGQTDQQAEELGGGDGDGDGDDVGDDVALLRELTQQQEEDLRMAATIGQKLLDTQEELHAELEAVREEKWLVNCEKDALKRDLEHATQRCEQIQNDAKLEVVSGDPPEQFELWSPAAAAAAAAAAPVQGISPSTSSPQMVSSFTTAAEDEIARLNQLVESLELANGTLNEKLIESHLETKAVRRASNEWRGQIMLDQKARFVDDKTEQRAQSGGMAEPAENVRGTAWVEDTLEDNEGSLVTDRTSRNGHEGELSLGGQGQGLPGQGLPAECSSPVDTRLEADRAVAEYSSPVDDKLEADRVVAESPVHARGERSQLQGDPENKPDEATSTPPRERDSTPAVLPSPGRTFKRLPSISEGQDEKTELIDALRGQVDQLRLEAQRAKTNTSATGTRGRRSAELLQDGRRGSSRHSSDEDSGSDNDDDDSGGGLELCPPLVSFKTAGEESAVGSINSNNDYDQTILMLRARARDLSAELLTANLDLVTLREKAQADQAALAELRRENLCFHRLGNNSAVVAAASARASTTAPPPSAHADYQRYDLHDNEDNYCLNYPGMRWLHGLWLKFGKDPGGEQRRNGEAEEVWEERGKYGSQGYEWKCREGDNLQFNVDERGSLLQEEETKMV